MTKQNALLTIPICNCYKKTTRGFIVHIQKIPILPPQKGLEFPVRPKILKKCVKLYWNFQRGGWGVLEKIPSAGEVWIFSGTTHKCFQPDCIWFSMAGKAI